uniref:FBA_2 domain-containing protein n=3 Tax=Caenorhabditis tropicalis TaxID=1561998 RepID=A0A1I7UA03_9PELO
MEINTFLKHWMSSDLKFEEIRIEMEAIRWDVLFSEISVVPRSNDVVRVYKDALKNINVSGRFDIKRNDGLTATIAFNGKLEGHSIFQMIIWDYLKCLTL